VDLGTVMAGGFALFAVLVIGFIGPAIWKVARAPLGEGEGFHEPMDPGRDTPSNLAGD
jgi:hypothetical protein